ncbi:uncharacterized protein I303_106267 [Kwoniella dejecticola CBS 10117]|uniref:Uncharacterized protein n=1 Tax=Kwoniella dejecticola CBS 10117 TaxID=1296121 RepID=A0A1A6A1R4_9TREE|nr:uncharacterized protein I303_06286 [Kwoniella dejecticola CBS 10117]OBR83999.1 hypothetical protein I303_06286 [Kwoniella dejecticola CBS 10117]
MTDQGMERVTDHSELDYNLSLDPGIRLGDLNTLRVGISTTWAQARDLADSMHAHSQTHGRFGFRQYKADVAQIESADGRQIAFMYAYRTNSGNVSERWYLYLNWPSTDGHDSQGEDDGRLTEYIPTQDEASRMSQIVYDSLPQQRPQERARDWGNDQWMTTDSRSRVHQKTFTQLSNHFVQPAKVKIVSPASVFVPRHEVNLAEGSLLMIALASEYVPRKHASEGDAYLSQGQMDWFVTSPHVEQGQAGVK